MPGYPKEFIDETLKRVHLATDSSADRDLDLRIERIFNASVIHDDHLDRYPSSAEKYTTSLDACRSAIRKVAPDGRWTLGIADGNHTATLIIGDRVITTPGRPSMELAIIYALLIRASEAK